MRCLDKSRLGNQVWREGMTLIRGGWKHHPANKMWVGHEFHLGLYMLAGWQVLLERGKEYVELRKRIEAEIEKHKDTGPPPWLGDDLFHKSHRSALLRKDPVWYGQFGWTEPNDLPYVWPMPNKVS